LRYECARCTHADLRDSKAEVSREVLLRENLDKDIKMFVSVSDNFATRDRLVRRVAHFVETSSETCPY